jgi:hypothetical protein
MPGLESSTEGGEHSYFVAFKEYFDTRCGSGFIVSFVPAQLRIYFLDLDEERVSYIIIPKDEAEI